MGCIEVIKTFYLYASDFFTNYLRANRISD